MNATLTNAKEQFLDLVSGAEGLDERLVVSNLLGEAGFRVVSLTKKQVTGRMLTGPDESEPYHANPCSGWEVLDIYGTNIPGKWLEYFWSTSKETLPNIGRVGALNLLISSFALCSSAEPVYITEYQEAVLPNFSGVGKPQPTDDSPLSREIIHAHCNCWADIREVSPRYNVILCRSCGLRVYVPKSVGTWGDLRKHFTSFNSLLTREDQFERAKPVNLENGWLPTGHTVNKTGVEALMLASNPFVWGCPETQSLIASPGLETTPIEKSE